MSEKENLRWTIVGLVIGGLITIFYDIIQELLKPTDVGIIGIKGIAGMGSLFIGLGFVVFFVCLKKLR